MVDQLGNGIDQQGLYMYRLSIFKLYDKATITFQCCYFEQFAIHFLT